MTLCCKISRGSFAAGHEETDPQSTILRWVSCPPVSKEQNLFCTVTDVLALLTSRCREYWLETKQTRTKFVLRRKNYFTKPIQ